APGRAQDGPRAHTRRQGAARARGFRPGLRRAAAQARDPEGAGPAAGDAPAPGRVPGRRHRPGGRHGRPDRVPPPGGGRARLTAGQRGRRADGRRRGGLPGTWKTRPPSAVPGLYWTGSWRSTEMTTRRAVRFPAEDIYDAPDDDKRYEVIDGELYVSKSPD